MTRDQALDEMVRGYQDGLRGISCHIVPSASYMHGYQNGRDDRLNTPRATVVDLKVAAERAIEADSRRPAIIPDTWI